MERLERTTTGIDTVDDDCTECLTRSSFECRLPSRIDVDEIEQGAQHPAHSGQTLGSRCGPSLIESQCQRLGTGLPGVVLALGRTMGRLGGIDRTDRGRDPLLDILHRCHERLLGRFGFGQLGAEAGGFDRAFLSLGGQHACPGGDALALLATSVSGGPECTQLATHLCGGTGGGGDPRGPLRFEGEPLGGERALRRCQFQCHRFELRGLGFDRGELRGESGGLGLERGHHTLIHRCSPYPFDAATAFSQHRGETACLLEQ